MEERLIANVKTEPILHALPYLIRFPKERLKTWKDMQQVMEYLATHEEDWSGFR